MKGMNNFHTHLVAGITGDSGGQQCPETNPEDKGLFQATLTDE